MNVRSAQVEPPSFVWFRFSLLFNEFMYFFLSLLLFCFYILCSFHCFVLYAEISGFHFHFHKRNMTHNETEEKRK